MIRTYEAVLRGDRLEWLEESPHSPGDAPLRVHVTVLEHVPASEGHRHGPAMAALLEKLAERGAFSAIADPVEWQRGIRQERALPGRER